MYHTANKRPLFLYFFSSRCLRNVAVSLDHRVRLEQERLEIELMKGLKGKGIPMTPATWKRMRTEAAQIIKSKR